MPTTFQSLPAKALHQILRGPDGTNNSSINIVDYRDKDTFRDLWLTGLENETPTVNGVTLDWTSGKQQTLIIGNDPPDGILDENLASLKGINLCRYFTAASWLAAWRVKFSPSGKERENGAKEGMARIAIIDPCVARFTSGPAHALQTILSATDSSGTTLVPRAAVLNAPSLDAICKWFQDSKADSRPTSDNLRDLLRSTIWNGLISDREQHHALSNVLGAFLLRSEVGGMTPATEIRHVQQYLDVLIRACGGGAPPYPRLQEERHEGGLQWIPRSLQVDIGAAVIIDDMADIWEDFLRPALGFVGGDSPGDPKSGHREYFEVFGGDHFGEDIFLLPERLSRFLDSGIRRLRALDLLGRESKIGEDFVLFLDLRLLMESDGFLANKFYLGLIDLGKRILSARNRSRPWLDPMLFMALEDELHGGNAYPRETLLPRLISLLDPTLPIVIFSSTHRTELIDPFREYGNIIIKFRKPILNGMADWATMVIDLHTDFNDAMDAAVGILRSRRFLANLEPCETVPL